MRARHLAFLCTLLLACVANAGTLTARNLTHASVARNYLEYRPTLLAAGLLPLVVVLHADSEAAATAASNSRASFQWQVISDAEGFVVAYPASVGNSWNDCGQVAITGTPSSAEDVGFLRRVAADMSSRFTIDQSRIYVSGASNGGLMSLRLMQEASETFAGAAAFASLNALDSVGECRPPANPGTVLYQYGSVDTLIQAAGGPRNQSAAATRSYWQGRLACLGAPLIDDYFDLDMTDNSTLSAERFQTCADGSSLHILTATGAGHTIPSLVYFAAGGQNRDVEAVDDAWKILKESVLGVDRWLASSFE